MQRDERVTQAVQLAHCAVDRPIAENGLIGELRVAAQERPHCVLQRDLDVLRDRTDTLADSGEVGLQALLVAAHRRYSPHSTGRTGA